jgi:hypothetical protein
MMRRIPSILPLVAASFGAVGILVSGPGSVVLYFAIGLALASIVLWLRPALYDPWRAPRRHRRR